MILKFAFKLVCICLFAICVTEGGNLASRANTKAIDSTDALTTQLKRSAFDGLGLVPKEILLDPEIFHEEEEQEARDSLNTNSLQTSLPQMSVIQSARKLGGGSCDLAAFEKWKDAPYRGILLTKSSFWRYQTQLQFVLSNGLALELAVSKCKHHFEKLQSFKSGKGGPIDIQNVWKAMCKDECMQSDIMHQNAMASTGCSCLELSTNSTAASFRVEGDWCLHNSAKMLCDMLGFCGVWGCRLDDFMCPRYEWNKKLIPYKGFGHCDRKSSSDRQYMVSWSTTLVSILLCVFLMSIQRF